MTPDNSISESINRYSHSGEPTLIADTPHPPYIAVIFTSIRTQVNDGYGSMADLMVELASQQDGFLGIESARNDVGITVSYWRDLESVKRWKQHTDHKVAQSKGRSDWYTQYKTRICVVERDYGFNTD